MEYRRAHRQVSRPLRVSVGPVTPRPTQLGTSESLANNAQASAPGSTADRRIPRRPAVRRFDPQGRIRARAAVIGPGRRIRGGSVVRSRTVDSRPTVVGPLSMIRSIAAVEIGQHMLGAGGREPVRPVRARCGDRLAGPLDQAAGDLAGGARARRRCLAGRHDVGDDWPSGSGRA